METLLAPVDIYCERLGVGFWAEPFNAVSNAAFVLAALWAAHTARHRNIRAPELWVLIILAGLIGIGSFLFHTYANGLTALADVIPIWGFVAVFILVGMHRIGGMRPGKIAMVVLAVIAVAIVMTVATDDVAADRSTTPDPLNGSGQYAPALLALGVFAALAWWRKHPLWHWIAGAFAVFAVSLVFRTIDMAVCIGFPIGTHFLWHGLNGVMIALLLQMILRTEPPR